MESAGSDQDSGQPAPEAAANDTREVMPGLLLRRSAGAEKEDQLLRQLGVTHVVCLSAEGVQGSSIESVECLEHVMRGMEPAGAATEELASLAQVVPSTAVFVRDGLAGGGRVLVQSAHSDVHSAAVAAAVRAVLVPGEDIGAACGHVRWAAEVPDAWHEPLGLAVATACVDILSDAPDLSVREVEVVEDEIVLELVQNFTGTTSGCVVWDCGIVASMLLATPAFRPQLAAHPLLVDLGSGTGIVALAAAALGARVVSTDEAPLLPIIERNMALNMALVEGAGGSCRAAELEWGGDVDLPRLLGGGADDTSELLPDFVVAADCVYDECVAVLVETLLALATTARTCVVRHCLSLTFHAPFTAFP